MKRVWLFVASLFLLALAAPAQPTKARPVQLRYALEGEVYYLEPDTQRLPDFSTRKPVAKISATELNVPDRLCELGFPGVANRFEWFAIDFRGTVTIKKSGRYFFLLTSDDGSRLFIDDELIIDNDGIHGARTEEGEVELGRGTHRIRVAYFQGPRSSIALVLEAYLVGK